MLNKQKGDWTDKINKTLIHRFWSYVNKTKRCWNWNGGLFPNGYGQFRVGNNKVKTHRFSWIINGGFIPEGYCILHKCDNARCVNPSHLFLGTNKDNALDRDRKNRGASNNFHPLPGALNPSSKLKTNQVLTILNLAACGIATYQIAKAFKMSKSQIRSIRYRRSWQSLAI